MEEGLVSRLFVLFLVPTVLSVCMLVYFTLVPVWLLFGFCFCLGKEDSHLPDKDTGFGRGREERIQKSSFVWIWIHFGHFLGGEGLRRC